MAAAFIRAAEDELSCPICLELFVGQYVPKDLPGCDHMVCKVCLKKLSKNLKGGTRIINCPECRTESKLPKDGVNALKTNRKVRNLAEKHPRGVKETSRDVSDETCGDAKDKTPQGAKPKVPMCPDHKAERMHYYCTSCDVVACLACLVAKHPGHAIVGIKDKYKVPHQVMKDQLIEAKSKIALCGDGLDTLQDHRRYYRLCQDTKEQVCKTQTMEENRIENELEEFLNRLGQEEKGLIDQQLSECGQHMTRLESVYSAVATAHADFTYYMTISQDRSSLCDQIKLITIKRPDIKITMGGMAQEALRKKSGRLDKAGDDIDKTSNSKRSTKLTLTQTIDIPDGLFHGPDNSMDWTSSGMLAVLLRRKREVAIYRKRNDQYKMDRTWRLIYPSSRLGMILSGIAFGPQNNIFVAACDHIEIYTFKGDLIDQFNMGEMIGPTTLEVMSGFTSIRVTNEGLMIVGHEDNSDNSSIIVANHLARKREGLFIDAIAPPKCTTLIPDGKSDKTSCIAISGDGCNVRVLLIGNGIEKLRIHDMQMVTAICYHEQTTSLLAVTKNGSCIEQYCCVSGKKLACLLESGSVKGEMSDVEVSAGGILAVVLKLGGFKRAIQLYQID